jgi:hypothetical protein
VNEHSTKYRKEKPTKLASLLLELTPLEVESVDIVTSETEQQGSLDTLTTMQYDVAAVSTKNGNFPINGGSICCCSACSHYCCCS